ncbi:hypothetical protein EJ02DRAFT_452965 [Clathrospora elynae]|uniref:Uncharacterized protein n=1 Tax=Clathrospora elynae TaxID=706981 RepID=A0A6A5STX8_9PLEO|nr:hypothetical protein EJ02DRAFT_452965 [Clathrospora elynae]
MAGATSTRLNDVVHHATAEYNILSDAYVNKSDECSTLHDALTKNSAECEFYSNLYEQAQRASSGAALLPPIHANFYTASSQPVQINTINVHLQHLSVSPSTLTPSEPASAAHTVGSLPLRHGRFPNSAPSVPVPDGEDISKAPTYRQPCKRESSHYNKRGCLHLHPDQVELYSYLIPTLYLNKDGKQAAFSGGVI